MLDESKFTFTRLSNKPWLASTKVIIWKVQATSIVFARHAVTVVDLCNLKQREKEVPDVGLKPKGFSDHTKNP